MLDRIPLKEIAIAGPVFGTLLAVSFGSGYFSAVGLNFFMLFSLSGHITAAAPSMPIAFFAGLLVTGGIYLEFWRKKIQDKYKEMPRPKYFRPASSILSVISTALVIWMIYRDWRTEEHFYILMGLTALTMLAIAIGRFLDKYPIFAQFGFCAVAIAIAWLVGNFFGLTIVSSPTTPYETVVDGNKYKGSLLYGGENGILFFVPDLGRTFYFRSDSIKYVSREKPTH